MAGSGEKTLSAQQMLDNYITTFGDLTGTPQQIEKAVKYVNEPTIRGLLDDASALGPKAMSNFAQAFVDMGTNARSMSPSARIANAQFRSAEGMNDINQNRGLRSYWNSSINDLVSKVKEMFTQGQQSALTAYQLKNQAEQQEWERQMALRALYANNVQPYNPGDPVRDTGWPTTTNKPKRATGWSTTGTGKNNSLGRLITGTTPTVNNSAVPITIPQNPTYNALTSYGIGARPTWGLNSAAWNLPVKTI